MITIFYINEIMFIHFFKVSFGNEYLSNSYFIIFVCQIRRYESIFNCYKYYVVGKAPY